MEDFYDKILFSTATGAARQGEDRGGGQKQGGELRKGLRPKDSASACVPIEKCLTGQKGPEETTVEDLDEGDELKQRNRDACRMMRSGLVQGPLFITNPSL
eukprot:1149522-Pelagomonas_calceolata.AAC.4